MRAKSFIIVSLSALVTLVISSLFLTLSSAETKKSRETRLTVFAASSLSKVFSELAKTFERENPSMKIRFSFLSSSVLASQLVEGAPADIFASASRSDMRTAGARMISPKSFASNRIVLAVNKSSNVKISKLEDLNRSGVKWIQCSHSVACGKATDSALSEFKLVTSNPVSLEPSAASVVTKLLSKEVDAAFIYHTDVVENSGALKEMSFPDKKSGRTVYEIGATRESKSLSQSRKFINFVLSPPGQKVLLHAGFGSTK